MKYSYEKKVTKDGALVFDFGKTAETMNIFFFTDVGSLHSIEMFLQAAKEALNNGKEKELTGNTSTAKMGKEKVFIQNNYFLELECELETNEFIDILTDYKNELENLKKK